MKDVGTLWNAESTSNEDRKELLRLLIEDVWLYTHREERQIDVRILWKGGSQTIHRATWWLNGRGIKDEVLGRLRELDSEGLSDAEVAERLNTEGYRRFDGGRFAKDNVRVIRLRYDIRKVPRPRDPHVYNAKEATRRLGITIESLRGLIRNGVLEATRHRWKNEWRIKITPEDEARLRSQWKQENEYTAREVARRLGIPAWQVYYELGQGSIQARRTQVGGRVRVFFPEEEVRKLQQRLVSSDSH